MTQRKENSTQLGLVITVILLAAASRFMPHPYNFTPITALALFGGAKLSNRVQAFLIVGAAMLISDAILGFHAAMPFVYLAFGIGVIIGSALKTEQGMGKLALATLANSIIFFFLTNFGTWLAEPNLYPLTLAGLSECFTMAIPFFTHQFLGDVFFVVLMFGGYALLERTLVKARVCA